MRAIVLLLVLMGMAEIGWGQKFERDTSDCQIDTFYRHVNYHKKVEWREYIDSIHSTQIDTLDLYQRCRFISEYSITYDFKYIFNAWHNKHLDKSYPMKYFHLLLFVSIKKNLGIGISIMEYFPNGIQTFNEMYDDFEISDPVLEFIEIRPRRTALSFGYDYSHSKHWGFESKFGFQMEEYSTIGKIPHISSKDYNVKNTYGILTDLTMAYYLRHNKNVFYRFSFGVHIDYMGYDRSMPQLKRFMSGAFLGIGMKIFPDESHYNKLN